MSELTKNEIDEFFGVMTNNIDYKGKLNEEQYKAVTTTEGPELIIAGAGSGKTTVLTYRLAYLIEKGVSPERILLLTFTNKAANEMITRALSMLGANCKINGGTFHSFCASILRQYNKEAGLSPEFLIKDTGEAADIINYVKELEGMNKEKDFPNGSQLVSMFSTSLNKAIPLRNVIKSYCHGKYESYTEEILQIQEAYSEYKKERSILDFDDLLVETNQMLQNNDDVRRKISNCYEYIMVDEYQDSNILQFELLSLLRSFENKNICVVGDDQQCVTEGTQILTDRGYVNVEDIVAGESLIAVACGDAQVKYAPPKEIIRRHYKGWVYEVTTKYGRKVCVTEKHTMFADDKNNDYSTDNLNFFLLGGPTGEDGRHLHKVEVTNKNLQGRLEQIDSENICDVLDEIDRILLEEKYPGIKYMQYASVTKGRPFKYMQAESLHPGMVTAAYREDNGTITSDTIVSVEKSIYDGYVYDINVDYYMNFIAGGICLHNCIYGFRGANHKNILNFPREFTPCKTVILFRNYRSNQEILDFTNMVAMEAKGRFDKELLGTHFSGHKPEIIYVEDELMEARAVLYDIVKRHSQGTPLNEMAVLMRNSRDSNLLETMIAQYSGRFPIPYKKFGGTKFLEKSHIRDILAFLKVLVNEKDEIQWFRIFQLYINIGPVYGRRLVDGINASGIESLNDKKHQGKKYGECLPDIYAWYKELQGLELSEQVDRIINVHYYNARKKSIDNKKSRSSVINQDRVQLNEDIEEAQALIEACKSYKNASEYLNDLALDANMNGEDANDFLTLSTVHSAKGLEFDTVYILNCIHGTFPWDSMGEELEEERRVFYVATTRAKENLKMYVPKMIKKFGKPDSTELSEFLQNTRGYCSVETIR